ncbi:MAG: formimidoylglutamate deiminase [Wenzhouxiangella sp.]
MSGESLTRWWAPYALTAEGWRERLLIEVDDAGWIVGLRPGSREEACQTFSGPVLPGMCNVHSHAHQRLIAGLTAYRAAGKDSFWSWRESMYRALDLLSPDDLADLSAWLYAELLEGGYTCNGEFHYPHFLGRAAALDSSLALRQGAEQAGCGLTLLPVWYRYSGFDRRAPEPAQARFVLDADDFLSLCHELNEHSASNAVRPSKQRLGIAPHSLRAVAVDDLNELVAAIPEDWPVHLHIAEQTGEVEACLASRGRRPVEDLLGNVTVDSRWCLIHATHITATEQADMLASGAAVGLCPTTEADLGDGLFPAAEWQAEGGRWAIGSDSNVCTSAASELRLLEWGQRLRCQQRNLLLTPPGHLGASLWQQAAAGGAGALAQPAGAIEVGRRADLVELQPDHSLLAGLSPDQQLDTFILAEQPGMINRVLVGGQCRVSQGVHRERERLEPAFVDLRRRLIKAMSQ